MQNNKESGMKLKIGYFAEGLWGVKGIEKIIVDSEIEVAFIYSKTNYNGILSDLAKKNDIDFLQDDSINDPAFLKKAKEYSCDLFVSISFNQIFKEALINTPKLATINWHAGKLPFYRGRNILNWALINGETEFGITVHYMEIGIDTGDIILQKNFAISENDDYKSLFDKITDYCAGTIYDAVVKFKNGRVEGIKQGDIHPTGFYCTYRKNGDEFIDFNQTSQEVFNFIRALSYPAIVARAKLHNKEMKINKAMLIRDAPSYKCPIGAILQKDKDGFLVKTKDSFIKIVEYEFDDKFSIGDRFELI